MPNMVQGFGPEGFEQSGGPQTMSPEQKLEDMMRMMGGAPNSVLMMIARILGQGGSGQAQAQPVPQQWDNLYPMTPAGQGGPQRFPGVDAGRLPTPMRPTEPPMMMNPNPGFIRG